MLLSECVLFLSSVVLLFFTVVVCSLCVLFLCARNDMMCVVLTLVLCVFRCVGEGVRDGGGTSESSDRAKKLWNCWRN